MKTVIFRLHSGPYRILEFNGRFCAHVKPPRFPTAGERLASSSFSAIQPNREVHRKRPLEWGSGEVTECSSACLWDFRRLYFFQHHVPAVRVADQVQDQFGGHAAPHDRGLGGADEPEPGVADGREPDAERARGRPGARVGQRRLLVVQLDVLAVPGGAREPRLAHGHGPRSGGGPAGVRETGPLAATDCGPQHSGVREIRLRLRLRRRRRRLRRRRTAQVGYVDGDLGCGRPQQQRQQTRRPPHGRRRSFGRLRSRRCTGRARSVPETGPPITRPSAPTGFSKASPATVVHRIRGRMRVQYDRV